MNYIKSLFIGIVMIMPMITSAQTNDVSTEELSSYKVRCEEYMNAFQKGLEIIADPKQSATIKAHYKKNLLTFFMGNGQPYTDIDGKRYPAPQMETSVMRYNNVIEKRTQSIGNYLDALDGLKSKYVEVKITKAQTCFAGNLYKVSDDRYVGIVSFFQYFEGKTADGYIYKDKTQKDIKVYMTRISDGNLGKFWDIKFGDVNVVETIRM